jgi:hypothetical protein
MMKISAVIAAGCLTLALGAWTSDGAAQQPAQRPGASTPVGSGGGVRTDPATQGTTDRAGQTPRPATPGGQPSGSVAVEDRKPDDTDTTAEPRRGGVGATDEPTTTDDGDRAGTPQGTSGRQDTTDSQPTDAQTTSSPDQSTDDNDNAASADDKPTGDAASNGDAGKKTGSGSRDSDSKAERQKGKKAEKR